MPEIDGPTLLREVQKLYPETIRIVLSGQSSRRALFEFIGICHQYLSKPCDAADLKAKINNAVRLRDVLGNPAVKGAVSGLCRVPSLPALYQEITKELNNSEPSLARVAEIISKDAGMTAKILQLTNSALLGIRFPVSDPLQAVSLLGLELIRALVITIHIFAPFEKLELAELDMNLLWKHLLATAKLSRAIAQAERAPKTDHRRQLYCRAPALSWQARVGLHYPGGVWRNSSGSEGGKEPARGRAGTFAMHALGSRRLSGWNLGFAESDRRSDCLAPYAADQWKQGFLSADRGLCRRPVD